MKRREVGPSHCPECQTDSRCIDSRKARDLNSIKGRCEWAEPLKPMLRGLPYRLRRFSCPACDHRWSTLEFKVPDLVTHLPERFR